MKVLECSVVDSIGLHARPASLAVNVACRFKCKVNLTYGDKTVDLKSIMGVMSLGVPNAAKIVIDCEGEDEEEAIEKIAEVLKSHEIIG